MDTLSRRVGASGVGVVLGGLFNGFGDLQRVVLIRSMAQLKLLALNPMPHSALPLTDAAPTHPNSIRPREKSMAGTVPGCDACKYSLRALALQVSIGLINVVCLGGKPHKNKLLSISTNAARINLVHRGVNIINMA